MSLPLSPAAQKAVDNAAGRRHSARLAWQRGPRVDGTTLFIPSEFYAPSAAPIYKRLGMRFDDIGKWWERDITLPFKGKVYSAEAWLKAARKAYKMVWPRWEPEGEGETA